MAESMFERRWSFAEWENLHSLIDFSGETARVCAGFPSLRPDHIGPLVLDLHQRHGQAIGEVLKLGIERHSAELVNRIIPPSSVLMMTVVPVERRHLPLSKWPRVRPATSAVTHTFWIRCRHGHTSLHLEVAARASRRLNARGVISELYPKACRASR